MTRPLDPAEKARRAQERANAKKHTAQGSTPRSALTTDPEFILPEPRRRPGQKPSKAATVRALLVKGKSKVEIVKKTGIPYPYIWDIEAAWKRSKEAAK